MVGLEEGRSLSIFLPPGSSADLLWVLLLRLRSSNDGGGPGTALPLRAFAWDSVSSGSGAIGGNPTRL